MNKRRIGQLTLVILLFLILVSAVTVLAANNIVPVTFLTNQTSAITASNLAPPECASIRNGLTTIIECDPSKKVCNGTNGNDLILGSPASENIKGKNGDDCILGGGGDDDTISGDNGNDVCIGGPGNDVFDSNKCETIIQ